MATANVLLDYLLTHAFSTSPRKATSLEAFPTSPLDDVTLGRCQAVFRVKILHFGVRHAPIFRPGLSPVQPTAELSSSRYPTSLLAVSCPTEPSGNSRSEKCVPPSQPWNGEGDGEEPCQLSSTHSALTAPSPQPASPNSC